jgi:glycosidase
MIEIYEQWITDVRVDGFRVDTARHVGIEFWPPFVAAILDHARDLGIEHFHIFGEVYEPDAGQLARFTTEGALPSVLDFAFQSAAQAYIVDGAPARVIERLILEDQVYADREATAAILPTFLGNHDMGRFAGFLRKAHPDLTDAEMFARTRLAHALMMFSRGVPVVYYGDEQGFVSDGGDQDARETLFPSQVDVYNDNDLIGTDATTADDNFDPTHPLYRAIAEMAAARHAWPALRRGRQVIRHSDLEGGLLAFSRLDDETGEEILVVVNAGTERRDASILVDGASTGWSSVLGDCVPEAPAASSYPVSVGPLDFLVCRSVRR